MRFVAPLLDLGAEDDKTGSSTVISSSSPSSSSDSESTSGINFELPVPLLPVLLLLLAPRLFVLDALVALLLVALSPFVPLFLLPF